MTTQWVHSKRLIGNCYGLTLIDVIHMRLRACKGGVICLMTYHLKMQEQTGGDFGGLGIELTMENGMIKVVAPMADTPASRAGLLSGDYIIALDKQSIEGLTLEKAVEKMRGPVKAPITLTIQRNGVDSPFDVTMTRDVIHIKPERYLDKAFADLDAALKIVPDDVDTLIDHAAGVDERSDHDAAISDYNAVLAANPNHVGALNGRAWAYAQKGELDKALTDADRAIFLDSTRAEILDTRGWIYIAKGNPDLALTDLDKALSIDPEFAGVYADRGRAEELKGDLDHAIADYRKALSLKSRGTYDDKAKAEALKRLATLGAVNMDSDGGNVVPPTEPQTLQSSSHRNCLFRGNWPMRFTILIVGTLVFGGSCFAQAGQPFPRRAPLPLAELQPTPDQSPTAEAAKAFVAKVESDLAEMLERYSRAYWIEITFITDDTNWLKAKINADLTALQVAEAEQAETFDHVDVDPVTRRKLEIVKRNLVLVPPNNRSAREELAAISARLDAHYSTSKVGHRGEQLTFEDIAQLMRTSRDPTELKDLWEEWHAAAAPMRYDYARLVTLANEGARALGYTDTGAVWRSWYDMPPEQFASTMERLWLQLEPLYKSLHCYVRARLNNKYGDVVQPRTGPIRADLLGNMWAQEWGNIYDLVAPKDLHLGYDLSAALDAQGYDSLKIVKTAENFYESIGFPPLPETFWARSMFVRPHDREVDCYGQAWDVDAKEDVRIAVCLRPNADDFYTAHHELGHNYYDLSYRDQPYLFRDGANDGFHEAIGDFIGLYSKSPDYLKNIGLIQQIPAAETDIPYLLLTALDKVAFLPFAYSVDKWRWQVFDGEVTPEHYNDAWWALRTKYQGIVPPGPRPPGAFDPGAKYHIVGSVPYARYFLAAIYQFQFYRAACREAGWTGPLNRCSIYGNKDVGERFQAMLRLGRSKPWPDALETFTGERDLDASALIEYFAPLDRWLTEQNKGESCGW
jgi:peptidyl-dipeptidase A